MSEQRASARIGKPVKSVAREERMCTSGRSAVLYTTALW